MNFPDWIDVKDDMPKKPGNYLTLKYQYTVKGRKKYGYEKFRTVMHFNPGADHFLGDHHKTDVTHWMELPPMPVTRTDGNYPH